MSFFRAHRATRVKVTRKRASQNAGGKAGAKNESNPRRQTDASGVLDNTCERREPYLAALRRLSYNASMLSTSHLPLRSTMNTSMRLPNTTGLSASAVTRAWSTKISTVAFRGEHLSPHSFAAA